MDKRLTFAALFILGLAVKLTSAAGDCQLRNGEMGQCISIYECPGAMKQLKARSQYVRCGFEGFAEIVCCAIEGGQPAAVTPATELINKNDDDDDIFFGPDEPIREIDQSGPSDSENSVQYPPNDRKSDQFCNQYSTGILDAVSPFILGGEEVSLGEFPHMAALGYAKEDGKEIDFDCGGTLVSQTYIVTAAHCVIRLDRIQPTVIRMGTITLTSQDVSETDYPVAEIIVHPEYKRSLNYHDIALIKLGKPVTFTGNIHPACLNTDATDPSGAMFITGWGSTSLQRDSKSKYLLKANVTAVSLSECNTKYMGKRRLPNGLTDLQMCAIDRSGLMDTCGGDSGGPLQTRHSVEGMYKLVGVTSFGQGCGGRIPGVYVRVANYLDWIEGIVWP